MRATHAQVSFADLEFIKTRVASISNSPWAAVLANNLMVIADLSRTSTRRYRLA